MDPIDAERTPRCTRCRRPAAMCFCTHLPRLETATRIVILQHTRERDMAHGTARMASLCLPARACTSASTGQGTRR